MEEEMVSMISNAGMATEGSDSYSSSNPVRPNKRTKNENRNSTKYKGVVSQQNGHWGAQIYTSQQRIWLGTFKTEKAAAMAYDSAALKLRPHDLHRNIPWTSITIQEPLFQGLYSSEAVLNMIKDGSYEAKFTEFVRTQSLEATNDINFEMRNAPVDRGGILYQQLFQKELTPSDVGKLNRLVIPKKHALTFFPQLPGASNKGDQRGNIIDDFQLIFYDNQLRSWKFRYCYWKSSQSYVFTKGWNRFVKEKELKAKDVVTFYRCEYKEEFCDERAFCMIDVKHDGGGKDEERNAVVEKDELDLDLGYWFECGSHGEVKKRATEEKVVGNASIRLFGVQING